MIGPMVDPKVSRHSVSYAMIVLKLCAALPPICT